MNHETDLAFMCYKKKSMFVPALGPQADLLQPVSIRETHFSALDGLRGLAALMIVAHHSALSYSMTNAFDKAYLRATSPLWIGVDLFFVLSGFLITNILLDTRRSSNYFRAFYGRRFVRIFPLYYSYLIAFFILLPALGITLSPDVIRMQAWEWTYTANIYNGFHIFQDANIEHFWTLAIEEQFYLLWPLIIFYTSEKHLKRGVIAVFLFLPPLRWACFEAGLSQAFIYNFTVTHSDGLILGGLISIVFREGMVDKLTSDANQSKIRVLDRIVVGMFLVISVGYYFVLGNHQFVFNMSTWPLSGQCIGITLISLPMAYLVLRAVSPIPNLLQRAVSMKYLRSIGKYSYALYVLHAPICHWVGTSFPTPSFLENSPGTWSFVH
ncbi:MAG: acyltransferase family protein, partial [Candidatus Kapaibacterium sp.]